jgi:hypothetical protein
MKTFSIVTIDEVLSHLRGRTIAGRVVLGEADYQRAQAYRQRYAPAE